MSEQKHTPEPWLDHAIEGPMKVTWAPAFAVRAIGKTSRQDEWVALFRDYDAARRFLAMQNALAGISTEELEALEQGGVQALADATSEAAWALHVISEREELDDVCDADGSRLCGTWACDEMGCIKGKQAWILSLLARLGRADT